MSEDDFLNKLFEKYETVSKKEKDKIKEILKEVEEKKQIDKVITSFNTKFDLAEQILEYIPLFYDDVGMWWRWNHNKFCWDIVDEVDILNNVTYSSYANTINAKERGEIIQALKQVSRQKRPEDAPLSWIQFGDEIIDIETGDRFKATSKYFLTNPLPYKLGEIEDTPTIDKIFEEWVGKEKVILLKEIMAYCMLRDYPIHRIFCFLGAGLNGKSCFLNLVRKFIGENNISSTELDILLNSRFEITKLHKKLVCQMGETNFSEMNKTSILKKISGNDLIGFEYKNKKPFGEKNYAKILIATNNLPATTDKTDGFYRRWISIDFPNRFTEKIDILSTIPEIEYNNLSLQLVGILIDLLKNRSFTNEGTIEQRKKDFEDRSNPLEKFMKEYVTESFEGYIWKWEFEKKLNEWCKENRFREISSVAIGKKMKDLQISQKLMSAGMFGESKQWRAWIGINWLNNQDNQDNQVTSTYSHM